MPAHKCVFIRSGGHSEAYLLDLSDMNVINHLLALQIHREGEEKGSLLNLLIFCFKISSLLMGGREGKKQGKGEGRFGYFLVYFLLSLWQDLHLM